MDELNTPMVMPPEESIPDWYDGKRINEVLFCQQFLKKHPMKCVRGRLFTVDGLIEDEAQIGNLILEEISGCLTSGLSKVVANLLASIKLQAYSPPLPIETDRIHGWAFHRGQKLLQQPSECGLSPRCTAACALAAIFIRAACPGGHSHLAGVYGLLPIAYHKGAENAPDDW